MDHRDILIVDDEISLLVLMQRIITERTPYSVHTTASSSEAAKELELNDYDLLIADLKMPGLDGMELLQWVKSLQKNTEVIIITAFGSAAAAMDAIRNGAYDYLAKPFRKEEILITVERAMQWRRLNARLAELERRIFHCEFAAAREAFKIEYARRALARCGGDLALACRATGLAEDDLRAAFREPSNMAL